MKKMMFGAFMALGFSMTAGCGGGDLGAKMTAFADKACACKDTACIEGVSKEMEEFMKSAQTGSEPSEADVKAMTAAAQKFGECAVKAATPAAPATP